MTRARHGVLPISDRIVRVSLLLFLIPEADVVIRCREVLRADGSGRFSSDRSARNQMEHLPVISLDQAGHGVAGVMC